MKKFLLASAICLSMSAFAAEVKLDERDLIVHTVKIVTPQPTGLESAVGRDRANELFTAIRKHKNVKPFIEATETLYKDKMKEAAKYLSNASVEFDCKNHPAPYGTENKDFCKITVKKSYGWYADLDLILEVTGWIHKSHAK